jgi:hypothetical protein
MLIITLVTGISKRASRLQADTLLFGHAPPKYVICDTIPLHPYGNTPQSTRTFISTPTTMHQGHNIPWNLITSNFKFKKHDRRFTPPRSGLLSKDKPNATRELKHFIQKFIHAVRTFSDTERAKYPEQNLMISDLPTEGNLFSDELKKKYPDFLNDKNQRIEYWIWRAKLGVSSSDRMKNGEEIVGYGWAEGDLAYVVEILLYENEMSTLIMMAHHPEIPIAHLHTLSCGYYPGFYRVRQLALWAYMFFNSAEATDILANGEYTHSDSYGSLLREVTTFMDQTPHLHFLQSCGLFDETGSFKTYSIHNLNPDWMQGLYVHTNFDSLHEYLKTLFSLLYRYDLLLRECEIEPGWELELARVYPINKVIKTRWVDDAMVIE